MTSTTGAWSNLFHGLPNRTPASHLYTEEAIQNEQLTADEVIEKSQSNASLLVEMVTAISADDNNETLQSFNNNDIIQTLHTQCQEMTDYLSERIWHDSGDSDNTHFRGYDSSSTATTQNKTTEEEAQIAAFISCNEQIQAAFKRYEELKDHLQAKEMQEEEIARSRGYNVTRPSEASILDDVDDYTGGGTASEAVAQVFGNRNSNYEDDDDEASDFVNGISIAGHDARQVHLRKSEQPLVWRLDPREDFKANKNKNKKWIDRAEKDRQERERMLERSPRNGIHGLAPEPEPLEITPEVEVVQTSTGTEGAEVLAAAECSQSVQSTEAHIVLEASNIDGEEKEEEEDHGIEKIQNRIVVVENDDSEEDEEDGENVNADEDEDDGVLSDDSWEEIPDQGVVNLAISDDLDVVTSSSSSPFLLTPANGGSSPNPGASTGPSITMSRPAMREI
ncbi:hypothetical protein BGZ96_004325 [Linnemannia gamsii]|uniref:Uncharacterized protein n=1 Tax=Linnemannia gamsii TaxID=64522 RepID=A0ABQ7JID7_9FUNG|nr:hypothetical protein BGZ96_004325 [Linnemannia gamsii]